MKASCSIAAASLFFMLGSAHAAAPHDKWPSKPIRLIVPFTPGAASDVLGRIVVQRLSEIYGQQFVVDNRPGAGGLIGSELTRQAAPDGYTFAMVGQPHLSNVLLREKKPYDPLKDFTAISLVGPQRDCARQGRRGENDSGADRACAGKTRHAQLRLGRRG
jgi:tripartite-type tricarboxylate transporter receptor subunit TctC